MTAAGAIPEGLHTKGVLRVAKRRWSGRSAVVDRGKMIPLNIADEGLSKLVSSFIIVKTKTCFHSTGAIRAFIPTKFLVVGTVWLCLGALLVPVATSFQPGSGRTVQAAPYSGSIRDYLRVERGLSKEANSLQTSIVRLVSGSGEDQLLVDLVSAVHIGDASYYETLNSQLGQYDAVLYELVAPEGTDIAAALQARGDTDNPFATLLAFGKRIFGFRGQLESVDYGRTNFVHADLSPAQMMDAIRSRGDNELSVGLSIAADIVRAANVEVAKAEASASAEPATPAGEPDLLAWVTDPTTPVKLKRMLADQFDSTDLSNQIGPTLNTILVSDRNKRASEVLAEQIAAGKKRIAIFYGAAHMPDLEKRIADAHNLRRTVTHWLTAWDLRIPGTETQPTLTVSNN